MKIYVAVLLALAYLMRDYSGAPIWIIGLGAFVPFRYAKDFSDKHFS